MCQVFYTVACFSASGREGVLENGGVRLMLRALADHPVSCAEPVLACIGWLAGAMHEYQVICFDSGVVPVLASVLSSLVLAVPGGCGGFSPVLHGPATAAAVAEMCKYPKLLPDIVGAFLDADGVVSSLQHLQPMLEFWCSETDEPNPATTALRFIMPRHEKREKAKAALKQLVQVVLATAPGDEGRRALRLIKTLCSNAIKVGSSCTCLQTRAHTRLHQTMVVTFPQNPTKRDVDTSTNAFKHIKATYGTGLLLAAGWMYEASEGVAATQKSLRMIVSADALPRMTAVIAAIDAALA